MLFRKKGKLGSGELLTGDGKSTSRMNEANVLLKFNILFLSQSSIMVCFALGTPLRHNPGSRFHCIFMKLQNFQLTASVPCKMPAAIGFDALRARVPISFYLPSFRSLFRKFVQIHLCFLLP